MARIKTKGTQVWRSPRKQKILLLLEAGITLSMTRSVSKQSFIIRSMAREWKKIDRQYLYRVLNEFKYGRLIEYREHQDGSIKIVLTEAGQRRVIQANIDNLTISKPTRWDGRWHLVFFDVPEKKRRGRDALRLKLRELGFYEWQKSVFVYPYPCRDQIDFIVEFFELRPFVRYGELLNPTNEAELKLHFQLES
jgi:hypothetical protein